MGRGELELLLREQAEERGGDEDKEEKEETIEWIDDNLVVYHQFHIFLDTQSDTTAMLVRIWSELSRECLKGKLNRKLASTMKII